MLADDDDTLMRLFSSSPRRSFIVSLLTDSGGSASRLQPVSLSCSSFTGLTTINQIKQLIRVYFKLVSVSCTLVYFEFAKLVIDVLSVGFLDSDG